MSQYIGKTISLISSKGIRYVGVLADVNGEEATVTLKNVKLFGSEGRLEEPSKEIPASNDVYPVVVFRGADVRDLSVLDEPVTETPAPAPAPAAPVLKTTTDATPPPVYPANPSAPSQPQVSRAAKQTRAERPEPTKADEPSNESEKEKKEKKDDEEQSRKDEKKPTPRSTTTQQHYSATRRPVDTFNTSVPDSDFDFESANAKFSEMDIKDDLQKAREEASEEVAEPAYDKKKSFFDNISNSATEKRPQRPDFGNGSRPDFGNNRRPDFGNGSRPDFGNDSWGRSGRGGRGRGRGRGRGGRGGSWNNNNNNGSYASEGY